MNKQHWAFAVLYSAVLTAVLVFTLQPAHAEVFHLISGAHYSAVAAPGANTDAITDITWKRQWGETLYLVVQCETSTVINLMVNDGTNEIDNGLQKNVALVAGARYEMTFRGMREDFVINLQSETDTIWDTITVGFIKEK